MQRPGPWLRWLLPILAWPGLASAQTGVGDAATAWQHAMEMTEKGQTTEAIAALVALDRQLRKNPSSAQTALARYFILYNLAQAGRYQELVPRLNLVRAEDLPDVFQVDRVRIEAEARLQTGDAAAALDLLQSVPKTSGRLELLRGRALASSGDSPAAREALTRGLLTADDASPIEKQRAVLALTVLLEADKRPAEADRILRVSEYVHGSLQADE